MTERQRIVQYGGSWVTNIGNAFVDMGSKRAIERSLDDVNVIISSSFGRWIGEKFRRKLTDIVLNRRGNTRDLFDPASALDADYVVQSGACLSERWFDLRGDVLRRARQNGAELIFHGVGFSEWAYDEENIEYVQEWMEDVEPHAILTRDKRTYERLRGIAEHTYNGIDCGFYLSDAHEPMGFRDEEYVSVCFDKKREPERFAHREETVVRPHHSFWYPWSLTEYPRMIHQYYRKDNTYVSDVPEEYINIYAGSTTTFSDRVHACVATLAFGNPARLFIDTPRSHLFDRVDHGDVTSEQIEPDLELLDREKSDQSAFLSEIL